MAPLAMTALYLTAFSKLIFGDRNLATFQDNTYMLHPIFHHIANGFRHGEYPYWMNTLMAGLPLYNSPQFSPEYPFYFFWLGFYSTPLNALIDTNFVILFHFFVIYLNTYVMLRVFRLSPIPALLGASLFAFSPNTVSYGVWVNIIAPYSWFPLVVASVFLVLEESPRQARSTIGHFILVLVNTGIACSTPHAFSFCNWDSVSLLCSTLPETQRQKHALACDQEHVRPGNPDFFDCKSQYPTGAIGHREYDPIYRRPSTYSG